MKKLLVSALVMLLGMSSLSAPALAADAGPAPSSVWPPHSQRARGILVGGGFGVSGCTDDLCDNVDPLVYFRLQGVVRILNYLGLGLQLGMSFHDPEDRFTDVVYNTFLGLEVRGILPLGRFDLWTGIALGYMRHQADGEVCSRRMCYDGSLWYDGFGFAWGLGALFYVTQRLALGMDFWLYQPGYTNECWDGDLVGHGCDNPPDDIFGVTWNVGVSAFWWLPF